MHILFLLVNLISERNGICDIVTLPNDIKKGVTLDSNTKIFLVQQLKTTTEIINLGKSRNHLSFIKKKDR